MNPRIGSSSQYTSSLYSNMIILGSALTFSHSLFITVHSLPSFISFSTSHVLPRLKPRQVPLTRWGLQVLVLTSGSLLNNWAFAYNVPLTILIVFRSASEACFLRPFLYDWFLFNLGLPVSMLFGYYFLHKRYNMRQTVRESNSLPRNAVDGK